MNDFGHLSDLALPRLGLLREITDHAVLDEVFHRARVTRVELASATGISRPTIWESVRRLEGAGVLSAVGCEETGRRGRAATFYELARDAGWVLALDVKEAGIRTCAADLAGRCLGEARQPPVAPGDARALAGAVRQAREHSVRACSGRGALQAVALSLTNPACPEIRETAALADLDQAPLLVDNNVNLAALAEREAGAARDASSFVYIYVGADLGLGLHIGDQLIRGAHGRAGEIGCLAVPTGNGGFCTLAAAYSGLGPGQPDPPSGDVASVLSMVAQAAAGDAAAITATRGLGATIGQAVVAACAVVDPELVLLGGPIGSQSAVLELVRAAVARILPGQVRIEAGRIGDGASLQGALHLALYHGRKQLASGFRQ